MVNSAQILLLATTILCPAKHALAADVDNSWTTQAFVACVEALGPTPSRAAVYDCHDEQKSYKRGMPHNGTSAYLHFFNTRDDKPSWTADCGSEDKLPKNFEIVTHIRDNAAQYCEDLQQGVVEYGVSLIDKKLDDAVTKTAAELHGGKTVLLRMAFTLTPEGRALMTGKQLTEETYHDLCTGAMTALATKGEGCTHEIHAMSLKAGRRYQVTGAMSGSMNIKVGDTIFGFVSNMYTKP